MGTITKISNISETLEVDYDGKIAEYAFSDLDQIEHSYAITVHKSQGSEFDVVILPIVRTAPMLLTRNLLYTAITRAKKLLIIVGSKDVIQFMIKNTDAKVRNTRVTAKTRRNIEVITILDFLLDIIYPNVCGFCGKININSLCDDCYLKISKILDYNIVEVKDKNFSKHIYLGKYDGEFRNNILAYKFSEKSYMYKTFAKLILKNEKICRIIKSYDIIIPVPIHKERKKDRGYNQSELIAKEIAKNVKEIKYVNPLIKIKNNERQSLLKKEERKQNVKNVYQIQNRQIIEGKRIVLFDDIYTTGSTVDECAKVLRQNGAKDIIAFTLAS